MREGSTVFCLPGGDCPNCTRKKTASHPFDTGPDPSEDRNTWGDFKFVLANVQPVAAAIAFLQRGRLYVAAKREAVSKSKAATAAK